MARAQSTMSVVASSLIVHPLGNGPQELVNRGRGRGGAYSLGGTQNDIYALAGRQDLKSLPGIVIGILSVSSHDVYELIYLGCTLSYVTPFVSDKFGIYK